MPAGFRHAAVFYADVAQLVDELVPFVLDGVRRGEPVLVAELPDRARALREALGDDADGVAFVDIGEVGANPARILPVWRAFAAAHRGEVLRGVGEPLWPGRRGAEVEECRLHESLLNVAFADASDFELLCPYDAARLPDEVLADAMRTHPHVEGRPRAAVYGGRVQARREFAHDLPAAPDDALEMRFGAFDLTGLRAVVRRLGEGAHLVPDAREDLVLAVHELASNSVEHGGGAGTLRSWSDADGLVVEVADPGRIHDPLVGREPVVGLDEGGRGVWIANQLCDLVQVRSGPRGTTVRLHCWA